LGLIPPHQLHPFGHNPLRHFVTDQLDCALQTEPRAAADIETGQAVLFDNAAITVAVLLHRAVCRSFSVGADQRSRLLRRRVCRQPDALTLAVAHATRRAGSNSRPTGTPPGRQSSSMAIISRLNEIACHTAGCGTRCITSDLTRDHARGG